MDYATPSCQASVYHLLPKRALALCLCIYLKERERENPWGASAEKKELNPFFLKSKVGVVKTAYCFHET